VKVRLIVPLVRREDIVYAVEMFLVVVVVVVVGRR